MRHRVKYAVALAVLLASSEADADATAPPPVILRLPAPRTLCRPSDLEGTAAICREVPPGRYYDEASWTKIDAELRRLQEVETRITAENASLRESAQGWQPGWRVLGIALASGFVGGLAAYHYASR